MLSVELIAPPSESDDVAELVLLPDEGGARRRRHGGGGVQRVRGVQRQSRLVQGGAQDGQETGWSKLLPFP